MGPDKKEEKRDKLGGILVMWMKNGCVSRRESQVERKMCGRKRLGKGKRKAI